MGSMLGAGASPPRRCMLAAPDPPCAPGDFGAWVLLLKDAVEGSSHAVSPLGSPPNPSAGLRLVFGWGFWPDHTNEGLIGLR